MDRIIRFRHLAIPAAIALAGLLPAKAWAAAPTNTFTPAQPVGGFVVCAGQANPIALSAANPGGTVTITQTGAPAFVSFTPALGTAAPSPVNQTITVTPPAGTTGTFNFTITSSDGMGGTTASPVTLVVDQPPTVTLGQAGNTVTPPAGGFNAPVGQAFVLDVTLTDPDATDTAQLGVGTSVNGGPVTNGAPAGAVQSPNTFGTDASGPNGTDLLGGIGAGGTFTSRLTWTPTLADLGKTFVIDYVAKDSRGCVTTVPVTVNVVATGAGTATTITVVSNPDVTTTLIQPDQVVCYTATVLDQNGNPLPNAPISFNIGGGPVNNVTVNGVPISNTSSGIAAPHGIIGGGSGTTTVSGVTDASGNATLCFTSLFPGSVSVSAASGTATLAFPTATVVVISTPGATVEGRGVIDFAPGTSPPIPGRFSLDLRSKTNGGFAGAIDLVQPGTRGRVFRARTTAISGIVINTISGQAGRRASIFGTMVVTGIPGLIPFRADAVDVTTPGSPGDSFIITLAVPGVPPAIIGGNLLFYQGDPGFRGYDVMVKPGVPTGNHGGLGGLGGGIGGGGNGGGGGGKSKK